MTQVLIHSNYVMKRCFPFFAERKRSFRKYRQSWRFEQNFWTKGEKAAKEKPVVT